MKCTLFFIAFLSTFSLYAHEVQFVTQHLDIRRQNETAWQSDLLASATVSRKFILGLQGTYLERFGLYEKRGGARIAYKPREDITIEGKILLGNHNEILPNQDYFLNAHWGMSKGLSPFIFYKNSIYSATHVQSVRAGIEIEKISNLIIIPTLLGGKATFSSPAETKNIYNYGLKVIYYRDAEYFFSLFGYKGREASQGIIGVSNILVDTTTGGGSFGLYFTPELLTELLFDYTDYDQLNNQFLTTTLNLVWRF